MKHLKSSIAFWEAIAILMGGTIGAGILAVPYGASQTGLVVAVIILIFVAAITLIKKLMMAEIVLRTESAHQLPGYIGHYLGHTWKIVGTFVFLFAAMCTVLAYMIGEGEVLSALFGGTSFQWSLMFFGVGSIIVYLGLTVIKRFEALLTIGMLSAVLIIGYLSFHMIQLDHFIHMMPKQWITPYTILLFAFSGVAVIPQMRQEMDGHEEKLRSAIITGSMIIAAIYLFFMVSVLGVTGLATTKVATIGLGRAIGPVMLLLGNSLAALTMGTSFLTLSLAVQDMFAYDFGFSHKKSWAITMLLPLLLFLSGLRDFIKSISIVGGVFLAIGMILVVCIFWVSKKKSTRHPEFDLGNLPLIGTSIIIIAAIGIILTVIKVI